MKLRFIWYDLWIGAYFSKEKRTWYICLLPAIVIIIPLKPKAQFHKDLFKELENES